MATGPSMRDRTEPWCARCEKAVEWSEMRIPATRVEQLLTCRCHGEFGTWALPRLLDLHWLEVFPELVVFCFDGSARWGDLRLERVVPLPGEVLHGY
jgi:hypothetical protein